VFACLVLREQLKLSYRGTEAMLRDAPHWLASIGMTRARARRTTTRSGARSA